MTIVRGYQNRYPGRFNVVEDSLGNLGTVKCINVMAEQVNTPLFAFCDQDDVWLPRKLEAAVRAVNAIQACETVPALVYCDMTVTNENLEPIAASFWDMGVGRRYALNLRGLPVLNAVAGCTMLGNLALLKAAFPVPPGAPMHDYWVGTVAKFTGRIAAIEMPLVLYRQHAVNQCGVRERPSLARRLVGRIRATGTFREQARHTRAVRTAMLQSLLERNHPGLDSEACRLALRAEQGTMLRRLGYLLAHGIRPDHAFSFWVA